MGNYTSIQNLTERLLAAVLADIDAPVRGELDLTQKHPLIRGRDDSTALFTFSKIKKKSHFRVGFLRWSAAHRRTPVSRPSLGPRHAPQYSDRLYSKCRPRLRFAALACGSPARSGHSPLVSVCGSSHLTISFV